MTPRIDTIRPAIVDASVETVAAEAPTAPRGSVDADGAVGHSMTVGFATVDLTLFGQPEAEKGVGVLDVMAGVVAAGSNASGSARLRQGLADADALAQLGQLEQARDRYLTLVNDPSLPDRDRAVASLALASMMRGWDPVGAELFYLRAVDIDATVSGARRFLLQLCVDRAETRRALALTDELLAEHPLDIGLLRTRANLLLEEGRAEEGLSVAQHVCDLARSLAPELVRATTFALINAHKRNNQPGEAVRLCRELLAQNPLDVEAHLAIAEYVIPDFEGPQRPVITELFDDAAEAYQSGDFRRAGDVALGILAIEPDEGLAHTLYWLAKSAEAQATHERAAGGARLLSQLATPDKRRALIDELVRIAAGARVGEEARTGTPKDLFVEWEQLTELQQATVAFSVLGYGELIPELIEAGACYRFALVGTSCADLDPTMNVTDHNAWGRHYYAVRGWQRDLFSVTGVEKIEGAARGDYNTITHEFAHIVHRYAITAAQEAEATAGVHAPGSSREVLARTARAIQKNYAVALAGEDGQALLDEYSGHDVLEYFAQAMMAYLNPLAGNGLESASRLFDRNPRMFELVRELAERFRSFPPEVPPVDHPRLGQAALGNPGTLARLERRGSMPELRSVARCTRERLERLYNPGAIDIQAYDIPPLAVQRYWSLLLQRAGELARIDAGELEPDYLGAPEEMLSMMGAAELRWHLAALRRAQAGRGADDTELIEAAADALRLGNLDEARVLFVRAAHRLPPANA